ncbi:MAG: cation:proton antiporter [Phycisphaerales bacterium JB063]
MELWQILFELIVLLSVAMVLGVIAERLKQSAVVGYMLAGVIVASTQGLIEDTDKINTLSQLGVTLLMFTIGLEFNWSRLKRLGVSALISGSLQIALTMGVAFVLASAFGFSWRAGVALGAALALSSTAVVLPVLQRRAEADSVHGRFALGVLLVQDVAVVPLVLIVGALATPEGQDAAGLGAILMGTLKGFGVVGAFVLLFFLFSKYALPPLVRLAAPTRNREVFTLFAFLMAMGSAWLANLVGLSPALGAFLAAIFLGESVIATQLRGDVGALKTVFVTLFFSAIGMYINPAELLATWWQVLVLTAMIVVLKPLVVAVVGLVMKLTVRSAVAAGCSMAQVGLFSFVLAQTAKDGGIITDADFKLLVSATVATLFLTPYTVAMGRPLGEHADRYFRRLGLIKSRIGQDQAASAMAGGHLVVVGYGPAGREVVASARDKGLPVIVLDLNPTSVIEARKLGHEAYVGDSTQPAILHLARLKTASALVITLPDHRLTTAIIVEAKSLVDDLRIIARARYHRYFGLLEGAGATTVIDEETQVGRRMADYLAAATSTSETPITDREKEKQREREKDKEKDVAANAPPDLFAD